MRLQIIIRQSQVKGHKTMLVINFEKPVLSFVALKKSKLTES